jgi:hypothetical protein
LIICLVIIATAVLAWAPFGADSEGRTEGGIKAGQVCGAQEKRRER